jgi:hypothetical protein
MSLFATQSLRFLYIVNKKEKIRRQQRLCDVLNTLYKDLLGHVFFN